MPSSTIGIDKRDESLEARGGDPSVYRRPRGPRGLASACAKGKEPACAKGKEPACAGKEHTTDDRSGNDGD